MTRAIGILNDTDFVGTPLKRLADVYPEQPAEVLREVVDMARTAINIARNVSIHEQGDWSAAIGAPINEALLPGQIQYRIDINYVDPSGGRSYHRNKRVTVNDRITYEDIEQTLIEFLDQLKGKDYNRDKEFQIDWNITWIQRGPQP